jgi:hypothetical protein
LRGRFASVVAGRKAIVSRRIDVDSHPQRGNERGNRAPRVVFPLSCIEFTRIPIDVTAAVRGDAPFQLPLAVRLVNERVRAALFAARAFAHVGKALNGSTVA